MMLENAGTINVENVEKEAQEIMGFLNAEIARRQAPVFIYTDSAAIRGRQLKIPAYVSGDGDAYDKATLLQGLEDAWNDRNPEPVLLANLIPATQPHNGVQHKQQHSETGR